MTRHEDVTRESRVSHGASHRTPTRPDPTRPVLLSRFIPKRHLSDARQSIGGWKC